MQIDNITKDERDQLGGLIYRIKAASFTISAVIATNGLSAEANNADVLAAANFLSLVAAPSQAFPAANDLLCREPELSNAICQINAGMDVLLDLADKLTQQQYRDEYEVVTEKLVIGGEVIAEVQHTFDREWTVIDPVSKRVWGVIKQSVTGDFTAQDVGVAYEYHADNLYNCVIQLVNANYSYQYK